VPEDLVEETPFTMGPELIRCPYPTYARLREEHPVRLLEPLQAYAVTRYTDVADVLRRTADFSSRRMSGPGSATPLARRVMDDPAYDDRVRGWARRRVEIAGSAPVLVNADPPRHTQQRKLINKAFTRVGSRPSSPPCSRSPTGWSTGLPPAVPPTSSASWRCHSR
jgi:cytochrome P450